MIRLSLSSLDGATRSLNSPLERNSGFPWDRGPLARTFPDAGETPAVPGFFLSEPKPALPRLNWSGYKEASYPGMPLLRVLHPAGRLDPLQSAWMQPRRAEIEFYDLGRDPPGLKNLAGDAGQRALIDSLRRKMDEWIVATGDRGALPDPATEPSLNQIQTSKRGDYQRAWKTRLQKPEPTDAERLAWWEMTYGLRPHNSAAR